MNEELQKALAEMINKSVAVAGDALAFTQEQLPEVVQQLLLWKMAISILAALAFLGTAAITVRFIRDCARGDWEDNNPSGTIPLIVKTITAFVLCVVVLPIAADEAPLLDWLQIWLAPKVYLIEYATNLVK